MGLLIFGILLKYVDVSPSFQSRQIWVPAILENVLYLPTQNWKIETNMIGWAQTETKMIWCDISIAASPLVKDWRL
jgi:hypothetical protein